MELDSRTSSFARAITAESLWREGLKERTQSTSSIGDGLPLSSSLRLLFLCSSSTFVVGPGESPSSFFGDGGTSSITTVETGASDAIALSIGVRSSSLRLPGIRVTCTVAAGTNPLLFRSALMVSGDGNNGITLFVAFSSRFLSRWRCCRITIE